MEIVIVFFSFIFLPLLTFTSHANYKLLYINRKNKTVSLSRLPNSQPVRNHIYYK